METVYDFIQRVYRVMMNEELTYEQALETVRVYEEIRRG